MELAFNEVKNDLEMQDYNLSIYARIDKDKELYSKVLETTKLDNIENWTAIKQRGMEIEKPNYSQEYKDVVDIREEESLYVGFNILETNSYKKYISELGLNYDDIKDKAILIDKTQFSVYNSEKNKNIKYDMRNFSYNKGDKIKGTLTENDKNIEVEVGFITENLPFGIIRYGNPKIIISEEYYDKAISNGTERDVNVFYKSNNPDKLQDEIEEFLKEYNISINNIAENAKVMENLFTLIAIFLYGFIIVISLIGITNIFNTITTNMELRKREFAMLKSIGMTKQEFSKLIRLESVFMGTKSLLFGIPIGLALSYLIYHFLTEESITYHPPFIAILASVIAVFLLITSLMKYSMNKINKQNTIETIRNENI